MSEKINNLDHEASSTKAESIETKRNSMIPIMLLTYGFIGIAGVIWLVYSRNPNSFELTADTLKVFNESLNAGVLLVIPFIFGALGAFTRMLMASVDMMKLVPIVLSSGLMAMFSWVAIKSHVLLAILAPHLDKKNITESITSQMGSDFYLMAIIAVVVGMFSSNMFIFVEQRVNQATSQKSNGA